MRIRGNLPRGTDKSVPYVMIISAYFRGLLSEARLGVVTNLQFYRKTMKLQT